jgi:hypothetical protein
MTIQSDGLFNAVSLLTNNFLAFVLTEKRAVTWLMNQLILPIQKPFAVRAGETVSVSFEYQAGGSIEALQESLVARPETRSAAVSDHTSLRRAA